MYRNNPAESSHQVSKGNAIFNPNFCKSFKLYLCSLLASQVENPQASDKEPTPPANPPQPMQEIQEMWVQFLVQDNPLEKEMATHSSIVVWKIP